MLAQAMRALLYVAWVCAVAAWIYGVRYFLPSWWAGMNGRERPVGYYDKAFGGFSLFVLIAGGALTAVIIANAWGFR